MRTIFKIIFFLALPFTIQSCLKVEQDPDVTNYAQNDVQVKAFVDNQGYTPLIYNNYTMYFKKVVNVGPNADSLVKLAKPTAGSQIKVKYKEKLLSDTSKVLNTVDSLYFAFQGNSVIPGFEQGVGQMKQGEKFLLAMPSSLAFGKNSSTNPVIPAYSPLLFEVTLVKMQSEKDLLREYGKNLKLKDPALKYTDSTLMNPLGVYYIQKDAGNGNPIADNQRVKVTYRGMIAGSNFMFDPAVTTNPNPDPSVITFIVGPNSGLIAGFNNGIKLMKDGGSGYLLMQSSAAYGSAGFSSIPGYTPLVFNIIKVELIP